MLELIDEGRGTDEHPVPLLFGEPTPGSPRVTG